MQTGYFVDENQTSPPIKLAEGTGIMQGRQNQRHPEQTFTKAQKKNILKKKEVPDIVQRRTTDRSSSLACDDPKYQNNKFLSTNSPHHQAAMPRS